MNSEIVIESEELCYDQEYFAFIFALITNIYPQVKNQISLYNYSLWQTNGAVSNTLGMPDYSGSSEGLEWISYKISDKCDLFFAFRDFAPSYIYSIQLTGKNSNMPSFAGIKLGDSFEKVIKIFGLPDSLDVVNGRRLCVYNGKNYSFLFEGQKLHSIKINTYEEMFDHDFDESIRTWDKIIKIIMAKDAKRLVEYLRPDIEINFDGSIYRIKEPMGKYSLSNDVLGK